MSRAFATVIFGLAASLCWGSGDFSGGLASRRANASSVVTAAYAVGFVLLLALALIWREPFPAPLDIVWGGLAGLAGAIGLISFYSALSIGRMGITAPVSAVLTATIPVLFSTFTEGLPNLLQLGGFVLALLAIPHQPGEPRLDLLAPGGCAFLLCALFAGRRGDTAATCAAQDDGCPSRIDRRSTGRHRKCFFRARCSCRPSRCRSRSLLPLSCSNGAAGGARFARARDAHTGRGYPAGAGGGSVDLGINKRLFVLHHRSSHPTGVVMWARVISAKQET